MNARASRWRVLAAFGGPVVWFAHFSLMYGVNAVECARGYDRTLIGVRPVTLTAAIATIAAVALILSFWRFGTDTDERDAAPGTTPDMLAFLTRWLGALSLLAILLTIVPVFIFRSC